MEEEYVQFWESGLFTFKNVDSMLSNDTRLFLEKVGLPFPNDMVGGSFSPLFEGIETIVKNNKTYFLIGNFNYGGEGDFVAGIEKTSEKIFFIDKSDQLAIDYININVRSFGYYLWKVCDLFQKTGKQVNEYEDQNTSSGFIQKYIYDRFYDFCKELMVIDATALLIGDYWNYWNCFWVSNFHLSFLEYVKSDDLDMLAQGIMPEAIK